MSSTHDEIGVQVDVAELAADLGASEVAVRRSLRRLVKHGVFIEYRPRPDAPPQYIPNPGFAASSRRRA